MSNEQTIECSNPACHCMVTAPLNAPAWCGEFCQDTEEDEEMDFCACGHPPCDTE